MPAIITHDLFGRDLIDKGLVPMGPSSAERQAFLLGNQGPDPLFYSIVASVRMKGFNHLGSLMHDEKTPELLTAFHNALKDFAGADIFIARAYALGFLCHYSLDSHMHPLVYFWQHNMCEVGVPDLTPENGHEVHAAIESEFDEMVLYVKQGKTIVDFAPQKEILRSTDFALEVISRLYCKVVDEVWDLQIPGDMFMACVKRFRAAAGVFHSPKGIRRHAIGTIEELVRPYSFLRAMSHRAQPLEDSLFANSQHGTWMEPATGDLRTDSFWDIFDDAQAYAADLMAAFRADGFDLEQAQRFVAGRNFDGNLLTESE